jgi:uncharacterized protein YdcH (DUF465 family)
MEPHDVATIERLLPAHHELRRLWEEHLRLDRELQALRERRVLTPVEEARCQEIRKTKLVGRDRIEAILREHRSGEMAAVPGASTRRMPR